MEANVHWTVPRNVSKYFTGRRDECRQIASALQSFHIESCKQKRYVLTGMPGQGKTELCLNIAHSLREAFWGVFWVDFTNRDEASEGFLRIARAFGALETIEGTKSLLANCQMPWLLILDNANDPKTPYDDYIPFRSYGTVLLASRMIECEVYATIGTTSLEGLSLEDSVRLLLQAAEIDHSPRNVVLANAIARYVDSHPQALVEASHHLREGDCDLERLTSIAKQPHGCLTAWPMTNAKFASSLQFVEEGTTRGDVLDLLQILCMSDEKQFSLQVMKEAWQGARTFYQCGDQQSVLTSLVSHLPTFLPLDEDTWDPYQITSSIDNLLSLGLVTRTRVEDQGVVISVHPLVSAWVRSPEHGHAVTRATNSAIALIAFAGFHKRMWPLLGKRLNARITQDRDDCVVCMSRKTDTVLVPCGHELCRKCNHGLKACPLCRKDIATSVMPVRTQ